jgi:hypothetical protein
VIPGFVLRGPGPDVKRVDDPTDPLAPIAQGKDSSSQGCPLHYQEL